jgi:cell division protein FtsB
MRILRRSRPRRRLRLVLVACALAVTAFLYWRPLAAYVETEDAVAQRRAEVQALEREQRLLRLRLAGAAGDAALLRSARRLGFVKPGERLFIVKGIDQWRVRNGQAVPGQERSHAP